MIHSKNDDDIYVSSRTPASKEFQRCAPTFPLLIAEIKLPLTTLLGSSAYLIILIDSEWGEKW